MSRIGEISDDYVAAFYRLVDGEAPRCPECGFKLSYDHQEDRVSCPKCNYIAKE